MKMTSLVAIAAFAMLAACGGSETSQNTAAPAPAVPAATASPAAKGPAAGPKLGPVDNITQPAKPAARAADPVEQAANDLIACEASGKIEADAFEKAKARVQADPNAVEKCRSAKK